MTRNEETSNAHVDGCPCPNCTARREVQLPAQRTMQPEHPHPAQTLADLDCRITSLRFDDER